MTTIQLKKALIHQIAEIEDVSFLNALKTILESKTQSNMIRLTNEQKNEIIRSKSEIKKGNYTEQLELNKEFEKWLNAN
ncbi:MAG: hypothetical protein PHS59_16245 [Paludibacter sp.]|nr:hypothetical protein [Paludibacter sp.]